MTGRPGTDSRRRAARRRLLAALAAATVWLLVAASLVVFGGGLAGAPGTAAAAQYKPPGAPTPVLSGLSNPAELAADSKGNLWFTQGGIPASSVTLYVLAEGSSTPVAMYTASGGNGSFTPFIIDIAIDAADNPHFIQWTGSGSSVESSLVRVDAATGTATTLDSVSGTHNSFELISGSALFETEIGADGTIYWTNQTVAASGDREARLFSLALGATAPALVAEFATPGVHHGIGNFDVAGDGTIYLQAGSSVAGSPGTGSTGIYRVRPGGPPEAIRVVPGPGPGGGPRPIYVSLDGKGNLIIGERIVNGLIRVGCAESTTLQLVRYDAASLAGPAPTGTVYSSATYPDFNFLFVGSSAYFRVSGDADVLFGLYASNSRCSGPSAPITFTHLRMIGVEGHDASGTQHVLFDDAPSPPASGFYSLALSGNDAFATSSRLGTLSQIELNKAGKKSKQ
jgi:hypothetical protein